MRLLIVSGQDALKKRIGSIEIVEQALHAYRNNKSDDFSSEFVYYDRPNRFKIRKAKKNAGEIRRFIQDIETKWGLIDALLIIGGPEVVPFHRMQNPCDDGDEVVFSDNPYASRDQDHEIPERICARIPDNKSSDFIIQHLKKMPEHKARSFGISARVWEKASKDVYSHIGKKEDVKLSPPVKSASFKSEWLRQKDYLYFNLHGSRISSNWYGQDGMDYPIAITLDRIDIPQGIAVAECCYGAYINGKTHKNSIALKLLSSEDVYGFCGSTMIAYGPVEPPSSEADLIAKYFLQYLQQGMNMGESFKNAKIDFARKALRRQGFLDEDDRKTLLEFVLYGDPFVRLGKG